MMSFRRGALIPLLLILLGGPIAAAPSPDVGPVGLVLSGGGARGFAHIGVLKALEEAGVKVDLIAATSIGAMVGGAYAAGYSADQIADIARGVDWQRMFAGRAERPDLAWRRKADDRAGLSSAEVGLSLSGLTLPVSVVPTQELDIFLAYATRPVEQISDLGKLPIPFTAMATDLVSGRRVAQREGVTLAQAMRASMSIPGVFAPVSRGEALLVDGGLVDNLPVAEARGMGAARLIVVNVGTPLAGRESLDSLSGIVEQVINLLTEQNVNVSLASLRPEDLLLDPDFGEFTSADFNKVDEIIAIGYQAARAALERLRDFAVPADEYAAWRDRIGRIEHGEKKHQISSVRVDGLSTVNPEAVRRESGVAPGEVSDKEVAKAANKLWASGDFGNVDFHFEPGPRGTEVLVLEPKEKSWGYSSLRFGGSLQTDFEHSNTFDILLAHTWSWLNDWGAEWRNELQFGETLLAHSEWHQPLGPGSPWYLMPSVEFRRDTIDLYEDSGGRPYSSYHNNELIAELTLGRDLGRWGTVGLEAGWMRLNSGLEAGLDIGSFSLSAPFVGLRLSADTLDNASFPRSGALLEVSAQRLFNISGSTAVVDGDADTVWRAEATLPLALGPRWSVILSGRYGASELPGAFTLGGVFNLSGSPEGRFNGDHVNLGRVMVTRSISPRLADLGLPVYLGATYEVGRAYNHNAFYGSGDHDWHHAASVFVASDTWFGPIYLVAGRTFREGGAVSFYWGRLR